MRRLVDLALLSLVFCSCVGPDYVMVGVGVTAPARTVIVSEGPRPDGYHRYRYYQYDEVYYDLDSRMYYYQDVNIGWQMTATLPTYVVLGNEGIVELNMVDDRPYRQHAVVVRDHPYGQDKKYEKEHHDRGHGWKHDNGKHRGERRD